MDFNPQLQLAGLLEWMAEQMNACRGKTAVIGALDEIDLILEGKAGTRVVPEKGVKYA